MDRTIAGPGIYFDMPEKIYRADRSLSASGCKNLLVSPLTYWIKSPFNPDRQEDRSDSKDRGKAFRTRILEGKEAFQRRYAILPDKADYPGLLATGEEMRARLAELGLKKSGSNAELAARILEAEPDAEVRPAIMDRWNRVGAGKTAIGSPLALEIERQARLVEMQEAARKAFDGGYPEVSLFWIDPDMGIPMKARIDYLKVAAAVDPKTFTDPFGMPTDVAIARAFANYRYHVQACIYGAGIEAAKALFRERGGDVVHGDVPHRWMDAFAEGPPHAFYFVFLEAGAVPNVRVREFRQTETYARTGATTNAYWEEGRRQCRSAIRTFKNCMETYGPDTPWVDAQPMRAFLDEEMPAYMFG